MSGAEPIAEPIGEPAAGPTAGAAAAPRRRTQAERSERTRTVLLDATIDCLVELGYARTSVHEICRRAGVSRGAQQHQFATKAELMAAAIEHLTYRLREVFLGALDEHATGPEQAIDLLWQAFSGTLSTAALELWVAARTDDELRAAMRPVDRALGHSTLELYRAATGDRLPAEHQETLFWLTVNLTRGLALDAEIGGDERRRTALLAEWKRLAAVFHAEHSAGANGGRTSIDRPGPRSGRPTTG